MDKSNGLRLIKAYPIPLFSLAGLAMGGFFYQLLGMVEIGDYIWYSVLIIGGIPLIIGIFRKLVSGKFAVDLIAMLAIITAVIMDQSLAGAIIILMQSGGEAIERFGMSRATSDLRKLMERRPKIAHLRGETGISDILAFDVRPGNILIVKPGELFPVDGMILNGETDIDQASITGEARLVHRGAKERVLSGTVNVTNAVEVVAEATSEESEYSRIIELVKKAQQDKAPIQRIADKYGIWLIPVTLLTAFAGFFITGNTITILSVFVVATPCPLILATPIALMGGLNKATRRGIIVKGGSAIEGLGTADTILFDKTGTLTSGRPVLKELIPFYGYDENELLRLAGIAEQLSTHSVAVSVTSAAIRKFGSLPIPESLEEIPGRGVTAVVEGREIVVGTYTLCREKSANRGSESFRWVQSLLEKIESTSTCIMENGEIAGLIVFTDTVRSGAKELVSEIRKIGIERVVMLTGDNLVNAQAVAEQIGIKEFKGELRPRDKSDYVTYEVNNGRRVIMVGDGINDAPALASATVGIAMGINGSDISSETADVILAVDDVTRVKDAITIGKRSIVIAKQSIFLGIGISLVFMAFAAVGRISPVEGAIIQEIIDAISILNSVRSGV